MMPARAVLAISFLLAVSACTGGDAGRESTLPTAGAHETKVSAPPASGIPAVPAEPVAGPATSRTDPDGAIASDPQASTVGTVAIIAAQPRPANIPVATGANLAQAAPQHREPTPIAAPRPVNADTTGKPADSLDQPEPYKVPDAVQPKPDNADAGKAADSLNRPEPNNVPDVVQPKLDNADAGKAADSSDKPELDIVTGAGQPRLDGADTAHEAVSGSDLAPTTSPTRATLSVAGNLGAGQERATAEAAEAIAPEVVSSDLDPGLTAGAGDPDADELARLAALPPDSAEAGVTAEEEEEPRKAASYADRSLQCDVVRLMGGAIGRWRLRGEERKPATDKAIDEVVRDTGNVRDKRFVFSGRVYGMLIYQLTQDHTAEGFGAYAQAACLVLRGGKGIVPADEASEEKLDQALRTCESTSRGAAGLDACISERMERIVRERSRRSG